MNKIFLTTLCLFIYSYSIEAQNKLSLNDAIKLAKSKSLRSKQIENRYQNSYWRNFSYKRQFLPSLTLNGTLPQIQRSISSVTQNDGTEIFVNRNVVTNSVNLNLNQIIPFTGGSIFVRSGLQNIQLSGNKSTTTYLSRPIEIGYSQNIFGFNSYKWDRKIEPLFYEEAELLKIEEIESLSSETASKYFSLLRNQFTLKNAEINLANSDTLYKIGKFRYKLGKISESELLQLELSLLNSELSFEQLKLSFELSKQELATFLGFSSQEDIVLRIDTIIPNIEVNYLEALNYATRYHSQNIKTQRDILDAEMNVERVKSQNRFNFNLSASFGLSQTSDNISNVYESPQTQELISLGVNVPLVQWGIGKGMIKKAKANADIVKEVAENERIEFEREVYEKVAKFKMNKKQLAINHKANLIAEKRFEVVKQKYIQGEISFIDLQIAQIAKDLALGSYISGYKSFWESYFDLRQITHFDFEKDKLISLSKD